MVDDFVEISPKMFIERKRFVELHFVLGLSKDEIVSFLSKETRARRSIRSHVGRPLVNQLRDGFV